MTRGAAVLALAAAGCPAGATTPTGPGPGPTPVAAIDAAPGTPDARVASEDEKLAMIQRAMNDLAPVANQCWAAGAVDDYLLKGTLTLQIAPHGDGARVAVVHDTTDDRVLTACMQTVASAYAWPAELAGEVIELPFAFDAPEGQFVIDRQLVPITGQAGVGVAVLLDEKNSGNAAATLLGLTFKADATLALAKTERHEVWYVITGDGTVAGAAKATTPLAPGTVVDVPAGAYRTIHAGATGLEAAVFVVPGQIEGVARGGAMPGQTVFGAVADKRPVAPRVIATPATFTADKRVVDMYLSSAAKGAAKDVALSVLSLADGAAVPEHAHANETEMLYVLAGSGTMIIDGVTLPITPTTVVQIPKGVAHQATVTAAIRAIQLYTPGGPEQRFVK